MRLSLGPLLPISALLCAGTLHAAPVVVFGARALDWKGFVFNLACTAEKIISYGTSCGGSPEQAALYRRILAALETPAQINGFGDPEDVWCRLLSNYGHYSFHAFGNWSFHNQVPCATTSFRQKVSFTAESTDPDLQRFYVCFMTSEGDTMKGPITVDRVVLFRL